MSVAAVTQAFSQYAQQTTGGGKSSSTKSSSTKPSSAEQEASETLSTTKSEAAHGDRQAKLKLAKVQQQQNAAPAAEPGKGESIDTKA